MTALIDTESLFRGKRITVMGLGLLGRGLLDTIFLAECGALVTVTDLKTETELAASVERLRGLDVRLKLGRHDEEDFVNTDMVLRNADVPRTSRFLRIAAENGVPVEMDESLFCKHFKGRVVGITGTRGKTTTTMLIYRVLGSQRSGVRLGGNIMGMATLPLLKEAEPDDTVILELSSWQLQGFHDAAISPHASIFTNIYPDHLNRYADMDEYINDKKAIYLYQREGDFCLFNGDQPETRALASESPSSTGFFSRKDVPKDWTVNIRGDHNLENIAAAVDLSRRLGASPDAIRREVAAFSGVEHRLQWLGSSNGVDYVNDTTSTTPIAGCAALDSFGNSRILLIAGGADKSLDLTPFAEAAARRASHIALLEGTATDALLDLMVQHGGRDKIVGRFDELKPAVASLADHAEPGDVVLLSPGCASFGMFRNEFDRGEQFVSIVKDILGE